MSDLGLVTNDGLILRARMMAGEPLGGLTWCAIGTGIWADKANPPLENFNQHTLTAEYARKRVSRIAYLQQDDTNGTITFNGHNYLEVVGPTATVSFVTTFLEEEVVGASICEVAMFGGPIATTASPLALANQTIVPGILYWLQNRPEFIKTARDRYDVRTIL